MTGTTALTTTNEEVNGEYAGGGLQSTKAKYDNIMKKKKNNIDTTNKNNSTTTTITTTTTAKKKRKKNSRYRDGEGKRTKARF